MLALGLWGSAQAALVDVTVKLENLAPASGVAFGPRHFGYNNGCFDALNIGQVATAPIILVLDGGSARQAAFAAADPTAMRGTIGGLLDAGQYVREPPLQRPGGGVGGTRLTLALPRVAPQ